MIPIGLVLNENAGHFDEIEVLPIAIFVHDLVQASGFGVTNHFAQVRDFLASFVSVRVKLLAHLTPDESQVWIKSVSRHLLRIVELQRDQNRVLGPVVRRLRSEAGWQGYDVKAMRRLEIHRDIGVALSPWLKLQLFLLVVAVIHDLQWAALVNAAHSIIAFQPSDRASSV